MRNTVALPLLLAALLAGCASLRPAPQPGLPLVETAPGCRAQHSLMDLSYDLYALEGATMVAATGAACPMPLDMYVGFLRAIYVVTGARVTLPPAHGTATIAQAAAQVAVIYRSAPGFTGHDGFTVAVLPANVPVPVSVTVGP
jgi:hypothetical protein